MNDYWEADFISFFVIFFKRMFLFCSGQLPWAELATDEIQIIVLFFIGISSSAVGVFLVLKRMTMMANALSHTILLGIVLAYLAVKALGSEKISMLDLKVLLGAALLSAFITMILTDLCKRVFKLHEEVSIGLVFTFLFSLGIIFITLYNRDVHLGSELIMGNLDALHINDLKLVFTMTCLNLLMVGLFFKSYQILAFDETFARSIGCFPLVFQYLLMIQTSCTAIGAFRAVGVFLFLIFLTAPILCARLFTHKIRLIIIYSTLISSFCSLLSVAFARHLLSQYNLAVSTAGLVCVVVSLSYPFGIFILKVKQTIILRFQRRRLNGYQPSHMGKSYAGD